MFENGEPLPGVRCTQDVPKGGVVLSERPFFKAPTISSQHETPEDDSELAKSMKKMDMRMERALGESLPVSSTQSVKILLGMLKEFGKIGESIGNPLWYLLKEPFRSLVQKDEATGELVFHTPKTEELFHLNNALKNKRREWAQSYAAEVRQRKKASPVPLDIPDLPQTEGTDNLTMKPHLPFQRELFEAAVRVFDYLPKDKLFHSVEPVRLVACLYEMVMGSQVLMKDPFGVCFAFGLYFTYAEIQHSCVPNAYPVFTHCGVTVVALKDLKEGEPVLVAQEPFVREIPRKTLFDSKLSNYIMGNGAYACTCGHCWEAARFQQKSPEAMAKVRNGEKNVATVEQVILVCRDSMRGKQYAKVANIMINMLNDSSMRSTIRDLLSPSMTMMMYTMIVRAMVMAFTLDMDNKYVKLLKGYLSKMQGVVEIYASIPEMADICAEAVGLYHYTELYLHCLEGYNYMKQLRETGEEELDVEEWAEKRQQFIRGFYRILEQLQENFAHIGTLELSQFAFLTNSVFSTIVLMVPTMVRWTGDLVIDDADLVSDMEEQQQPSEPDADATAAAAAADPQEVAKVAEEMTAVKVTDNE